MIIKNLFGHNNSFEESVNELIEEYNSERMDIGLEERTTLHNIISIGEIKISDIMVPRTDIVAL